MKKNEGQQIPTCVGIIMDGNRRWAKERNLPTLNGHQAGLDTLKEVLRWVKEYRIEYVVLYAFSTENRNRSKEEVTYLMQLFERALIEDIKEIEDEGARIKIIGDRSAFSKKLQGLMNEIEERTKENTGCCLVFALFYSGRVELVHALKTLQNAEEEVTEDVVAKHLWTTGIPDPDLIIRTGGEKRLSGFLPWQSVYSELFFVDTYWPAFSKEEFASILKEYGARERRMGR